MTEQIHDHAENANAARGHPVGEEIEVTEEMLMAGWKAHLGQIELVGCAAKTDLVEYGVIFKAMSAQQGSIPKEQLRDLTDEEATATADAALSDVVSMQSKGDVRIPIPEKEATYTIFSTGEFIHHLPSSVNIDGVVVDLEDLRKVVRQAHDTGYRGSNPDLMAAIDRIENLLSSDKGDGGD